MKKNIVIFSGGTGSQNLQRSIHKLCGNSVNVDVIISAYDNGKSTGEVRKAYDNKILGPSDLRKNQMLQYELYADDCLPKKLIIDFMNIRFDAIDSTQAYEICIEKSTDLMNAVFDFYKESTENELYISTVCKFRELIDNFFMHKDLSMINFYDFSMANIIYSALAANNNYSLSEAGYIMSIMLGIENRVHLISDINLYLNAITKSGSIISDEGQIVDWNNANDPIKRVLLLEADGTEYIPTIDENLKSDMSCEDIINNADIIIYSSGTQWSSEIPTYMHIGLRECLKKSKAKKYLIMNNTEDKDMKGINSAQLLKIVSEYIDLSDVTVVYNEFAEFSMRDQHDREVENIIGRSISGKLSNSADDKKHNLSIFPFIIKDYYRQYLDSDLYVFDFDDTLYSRSAELTEISKENLNLLNNCRKKSFILSGNSINRFKEVIKGISTDVAKNVFSMLCINGGNSIYNYDEIYGLVEKIKLFDDITIKDYYYILIKDIIGISENKISVAQFENRGNIVISIKPVPKEIRNELVEKINNEFENKKIQLKAYATGRSTIDIMPEWYNKLESFKRIKETFYINDNKITYIGDELDNGNDESIKEAKDVNCLLVNNVYDTNLFLRVLNI